MKQAKWYFFFDFSQKKVENTKIYQNLQSTGHWPKSLGPVFISRLRAGRVPGKHSP